MPKTLSEAEFKLCLTAIVKACYTGPMLNQAERDRLNLLLSRKVTLQNEDDKDRQLDYLLRWFMEDLRREIDQLLFEDCH